MVQAKIGNQQGSCAPRNRKSVMGNKPGIFAGWISEKWRVAWVVSPHRRDKRTGWVQGEASNGPMAAEKES